jgi:citrate synthase
MIGASTTKELRGGLDEVVAVRTRLSKVDGVAGELVFVGHPVEELAANHGFEEVCYLLWRGESSPPMRRSPRLSSTRPPRGGVRTGRR